MKNVKLWLLFVYIVPWKHLSLLLYIDNLLLMGDNLEKINCIED